MDLNLNFYSERISPGAFSTYADVSSNSLTMSSGSSLASSTAGLHMQIPSTPIPVMITGPDDSLKCENMHTHLSVPQPSFYTHNEVIYPIKKLRKTVKILYRYYLFLVLCA